MARILCAFSETTGRDTFHDDKIQIGIYLSMTFQGIAEEERRVYRQNALTQWEQLRRQTALEDMPQDSSLFKTYFVIDTYRDKTDDQIRQMFPASAQGGCLLEE